VTRSADDSPSSYRWKTRSKNGEPVKTQQEYAQEITDLLVALADKIKQSEEDFQWGSPRARPEIRIVPDV